jgi:RNA polymerase sigma-70 factor (ECF subfamily)
MTEAPADLDYALLRRVAKKDEAALAELIRRHQHRLYNLAFRLLRDPLEAEDALQEVFFKAYHHAGTFQPVATVAAWLSRITANHCLNRLRGRHPLDYLDDDAAAAPADPGPTPLQALEEAELSRRLEALLNALPENQRRALILKQFGGLSYVEIGEELGVSAQAVDGLIKRARQRLRQVLELEGTATPGRRNR